MKRNGYFTSLTIIDITGARDTFDEEHMGSPVNAKKSNKLKCNYSIKKLLKQAARSSVKSYNK